MSSTLQRLINDLDQLTLNELWQLMSYLITQLQHKTTVVSESDESLLTSDRTNNDWDQQIADDLESGHLDHVIAKVTADIESNKFIDPVTLNHQSETTPDRSDKDISETWKQWFETTNRLEVTPSQEVSEYQKLLLDKYRHQGLEL